MAVYETRLIACPMCQAVTPHEVRKTNHGLHLVLTLMTFGLWLSIWLIAIVLGTGPGNASASDAPDMTARSSEPYRHPALVEPVLTIGGFDAIEGVPVFVMVDQTGQGVGVMEMPAKTND